MHDFSTDCEQGNYTSSGLQNNTAFTFLFVGPMIYLVRPNFNPLGYINEMLIVCVVILNQIIKKV